LVTVNEKHSVYTSPSSAKALQTMALSNLGSYASAYLSVPDSVKAHPRYAIFKMKAAVMAKIYGNVFKKIASTYQVHIVAGSILLPNPKSRIMRSFHKMDSCIMYRRCFNQWNYCD
jgi:hypothetical protein